MSHRLTLNQTLSSTYPRLFQEISNPPPPSHILPWLNKRRDILKAASTSTSGHRIHLIGTLSYATSTSRPSSPEISQL
ncbi:hypothetical protein NA56DRAFT_643020 [Hyaloscypha hepaticicola]|uniref:Uncharacterized protein n=1 Tax=Hyaloscypha hepaticicola TaxID=2082293 RepID=A0A2J6QDU5_9HELO|nr:hypothetical protein NA56DRAFT_643020 [Hyaloscypha hepaticicola]